jgi:hypothetical protein
MGEARTGLGKGRDLQTLKRSARHVWRRSALRAKLTLHRYLAEFDFRYNRRAALKISDAERHDMLLAAIRGKRLTYRRIGEARLA